MILQTLQNTTEESDEIGIRPLSSESGHRVESSHVSILAQMFFLLTKQVRDTEENSHSQAIHQTQHLNVDTVSHTVPEPFLLAH